MTKDEFIKECLDLHPTLRDDSEHGIVVRIIALRDLIELTSTKKRPRRVPREVMFDALADLVPSQREFWLRCEATDRERFIGGMTALFTMNCE